ncbi:MAG TPA: hypothetical protein VL357_01190 [Rariglobus sp.]|nr:hypothetical protein [Rariglobus sp.]
MSDNSDYRPIPGQTPLKLPPKPEPVAPVQADSSPPDEEIISSPSKPAISPSVVKLPSAPKFVSPMPKIEESDSDIPAFLPVVAGIAAVVTLAFSVLIYLKR